MIKMLLIFLVMAAFVLCKQDVAGGKVNVIDVRTVEEYQEGHLKNAINIPHTEIKEKIAEHVKDKEETIMLYCRSGRRSAIAENILKDMGYKNVINAGSYEKLKAKEIEENQKK